MTDTLTKPRATVRPKTERPKLHKVILVNDDYTPREFVVRVLKAEFRLNEDQAYRVMITAHRRGVCVVAVFAKDIAETKLAEIDRKIRELSQLRRTLEHLVHACHGNDRPDCPILEGLSDGG